VNETSSLAELIDQTDWAHLFHAYARATDTAEHLGDLLASDEKAFDAAMGHLDSAVLHQGSIFPATPAAVRCLAAVVAQPALLPDQSRLVRLLEYLATVGESLSWLELPEDRPVIDRAELDQLFAEWPEDGWAEADSIVDSLCTLAGFELTDLAADLLPSLATFLTDPDLEVREAGIDAFGYWAQVNPANAQAATDILRKQLDQAVVRDERARLVLALGEIGADLSDLLADTDPAIRACAALTTKSPAGNAELIAVLLEPQASDSWFESRPPQFLGWPRYTFQAELLSRQLPFDEVALAALAIVPLASAVTADFDWGPLLTAAFPGVVFTQGVRPGPPKALSSNQRVFLAALVRNESLWDPRNGNANLARMRVGLPDDRDEVARLVAELPASQRP
jgi:hypothetical protein